MINRLRNSAFSMAQSSTDSIDREFVVQRIALTASKGFRKDFWRILTESRGF